MFDYSRCTTVRQITTDTGRTYATPNGDYPSITTVLGKTKVAPALEAWKKRLGPAEARKQANASADRGTRIHSFMEAYHNIGRFGSDDVTQKAFAVAVAKCMEVPGAYEMATKLKDEARKHLGPIWAQETPLWSDELKVAGCVDAVAEWDGEMRIVDWKTSKAPKKLEWIEDYKLQVTFYALAHNELMGSKIEKYAICITNATGTVDTFTGEIAPWIEPLKARIEKFYTPKQLPLRYSEPF